MANRRRNLVLALAALGWVYQSSQLQRLRRDVRRAMPRDENAARTVLRDLVDQLPGGKYTVNRILDDITE